MAENKSTKVTGVFHSYMTPSGYTQRAEVECVECDLHVPSAADSMIGQCEYYYGPLHCAYKEKVEKLPSINEMIEWVTNFDVGGRAHTRTASWQAGPLDPTGMH